MRLTKAIINKNNLLHNFNEIKNYFPNHKILGLVKANAYGHGLINTSRLLESFGIDFLGVAYLDEAILLREAKIYTDIIVFVPEYLNENKYFEFNIQPAVSSIAFLNKLEEIGNNFSVKVNVHIYIDTGMNRDGFKNYEIDDLINVIPLYKNINFMGIFTHFVSSSIDIEFSKHQISEFDKIIEKFHSNNIFFQYYHCANSGAISNLDIGKYNLIRPGLSLYGYKPINQLYKNLHLKPILTLETEIIMKRKAKSGESVSYDRLYKCNGDSIIATIPLGYGDGFSKLLTNKANCIINNKLYPIVGAICMDECMIDLGNDDYPIGTKVIIIGISENIKIDANDLANSIGTIPYEITTAISERVPRIYI